MFLDLYWEFDGKPHMFNNGVNFNREGARPLWCTSGAKEKPNQLPTTKSSLPTSEKNDNDPATTAT